MIRSTWSSSLLAGKGTARLKYATLLTAACGLAGCSASHPSMLLGRLPANEPVASKPAPAVAGKTTDNPIVQPDATFPPSDTSSLASARQHPVYASDSSRVSKRDIIEWTTRGVREEVVLERIGRCGNIQRLTAADENQLRDAGVSETIIQEMRATANR